MWNMEFNGGSRSAMKRLLTIASVWLLLLSLAVSPLWAQSGRHIFNSTNNNPPVDHNGTLANPSEHPGNTMEEYGGEVQWPGTLANFVAEKISEAKAKGMNTREAEAQERLAVNWLRMGENLNAAQHFDTALRSLGIQPNVQGENVGETTTAHKPMPGQKTIPGENSPRPSH